MTEKPSAKQYWGDRREMLGYIPDSVQSILDVGRANGGFGRSLSQHRRSHLQVTGIDPNPGADLSDYEAVYRGSFPADLPSGLQFDCVVFNDVLEHMVDPWAALAAAQDRLTKPGFVVASIPNIRYWGVLVELVMRGQWEYRDVGVLDRTHLRFFTARTIRSAFELGGYRIVQLDSLNLATDGFVGLLRRATAATN